MPSLDKAVQTQISNIEKKTGKSLDELRSLVRGCGFSKHGEIRDWVKRELGLGHGDANTLVHIALASDGASQAEGKSDDAVLAEIYTGPKAALRPIHDALMAEIQRFGPFELAPKKGYVSLRGKKQFAMIGPATNSRVEVGLNMKDEPGTARLEVQPPKGMCSHKVKVTDAGQVDAELVAWIRKAYEGAQ